METTRHPGLEDAVLVPEDRAVVANCGCATFWRLPDVTSGELFSYFRERRRGISCPSASPTIRAVAGAGISATWATVFFSKYACGQSARLGRLGRLCGQGDRRSTNNSGWGIVRKRGPAHQFGGRQRTSRNGYLRCKANAYWGGLAPGLSPVDHDEVHAQTYKASKGRQRQLDPPRQEQPPWRNGTCE